MLNVLLASYVLKIFKTVVASIAVDVVDLVFVGFWAKKRLRHQAMHANRFALAFSPKHKHLVTGDGPWPQIHKGPAICPRAYALNIAAVTYPVMRFVPHDGAPSLSL